jgi:hypothetical protein
MANLQPLIPLPRQCDRSLTCVLDLATVDLLLLEHVKILFKIKVAIGLWNASDKLTPDLTANRDCQVRIVQRDMDSRLEGLIE